MRTNQRGIGKLLSHLTLINRIPGSYPVMVAGVHKSVTVCMDLPLQWLWLCKGLGVQVPPCNRHECAGTPMQQEAGGLHTGSVQQGTGVQGTGVQGPACNSFTVCRTPVQQGAGMQGRLCRRHAMRLLVCSEVPGSLPNAVLACGEVCKGVCATWCARGCMRISVQ